ncbi:glycosyl transferase [Nakamurella sp. PAMC28650]|nr:glycosyl transferase [Nakamurella sp. PAMC28650]
MIGYYVHHQGHGHLQRMTSIAAQLVEPLTVLSSLPRPGGGPPGIRRNEEPEWLHLPSDDTGAVFVEPTANGTLHWVPRHHPGLRARMALIASWIARTAPTLVVVDVSVEVATLCRLLGVPTVVMAMRGDRTDRAHRSAYDGAHALMATWTAEFADPAWPQAWHEKTFYAGPISRFTPAPPARTIAHGGPSRVLVLWGSGGSQDAAAAFTDAQLAEARRSGPDRTWRFAGGTGEHRVADGEVRFLLAWADVVITHAGQNAVAEVAASRTPAVVIADARPHGEQHDTAMTLDAAGVAVGLARWPQGDRWPVLLDAAIALGGHAWARWLAQDGAARAAAFLDETAASLVPTSTEASAT